MASNCWGAQDNFLPTRYFVLGQNGSIWRGSGSTTAPTFTRVAAPTGSFVAGSFPGRAAYFIVTDPWNFNRKLVYASEAIYAYNITDAPPWTPTVVFTPPSGFLLGYHKFANVFGDLIGSINIQGFWVWAAYNPSTGQSRIYRTTDNFVTTTYVAAPHAELPLKGLAVGFNASNANNVVVYASSYPYVYKSTRHPTVGKRGLAEGESAG
jgi:hypothetical protein